MSTAYGRALWLPGAWQFSASAFLARLPLSMIGLGAVVLISSTTGSYAAAGIVVATFGVVGAIGNVVIGRLADRVGQARLLPALAAVHVATLLGVVALVLGGAPLWSQAALAGLAGFLAPPIGSFVRARWVHVSPDAATLQAGFALESIIDELIFTVGPLLTAWLAFSYSLPLPLYVACAFCLSGSIFLAVQRRTQPTVHREHHEHRRSALLLPGMALLVLAAFGMGVLFGADEVSIVAFTRIAGAPSSSGIVLALWAIGSMLGGLYYGSRHWSAPLPRQGVILFGILACALAVLPWSTGVVMLAIVTFVAGFLVSPCLIVIFSLSERLVPAAQVTEGLTWASSALGFGYAAGSAGAGVLLDHAGTVAGFLLTVAAVLGSFVVLLIGQRTMTAHAASTAPEEPGTTYVQEPVPGPAPGGIEPQ